MTDTTTLAPTDAELESLWRIEASKSWSSTSDMRASFVRAALAKWGAPAPASGETEACKCCGEGSARIVVRRECDTCTSVYAGVAEHRLQKSLAAPPVQGALLNPDMPTQELRLHMGELTTDEVLVARAAIRWANSQQEAQMPLSDEHLYRLWRDCQPCNKHGASWHYGRAIEAAHGIGITAAQKETP